VPGIPFPAKQDVIFYSTRRTRWLLGTASEDLSEREAASITALKHLSPPLAEAQRLVAAVRSLLSERHEESRAPAERRSWNTVSSRASRTCSALPVGYAAMTLLYKRPCAPTGVKDRSRARFIA
jgi:hypothetical protein